MQMQRENLNFFKNRKSEVKRLYVNFLNGSYWLKTSLSTIFSRSRASFIPYVSLKELLSSRQLLEQNVLFVFNYSKNNILLFNQLNQLKKIDLTLSNKRIGQIIDDDSFLDLALEPNLNLRIDLKSLEALLAGYVPFYSRAYLQKLAQEIRDFKKLSAETLITLVWRKGGYLDLETVLEAQKQTRFCLHKKLTNCLKAKRDNKSKNPQKENA